MSKVTLRVEIEEEAYKQIKGDSVCSNNNECIISKSSSAYYALNAMINATPLTESDDCVSRQALLRKMNTKTHEYGNGLGFRKEWVELINSMPPVTPKRKHGEWIDCQDEGYVVCPICGSATNCDDNKEDLHYCFSCGAEMR